MACDLFTLGSFRSPVGEANRSEMQRTHMGGGGREEISLSPTAVSNGYYIMLIMFMIMCCMSYTL